MAKRGQKPKSPAIKKLEGNRGHKPIKQSVNIVLSMPGCPKWLVAIGKAEWKRVAPRLYELGLLDKIDLAALASYCQNYAIVVQCSNYISKKGGFAKYIEQWAKTISGPPRHIAEMQKAMSQIRMFCAEFGLTPSARGRMELPTPEDEDEDLD
jgi:P27 family predicted phage terminase small subunit